MDINGGGGPIKDIKSFRNRLSIYNTLKYYSIYSRILKNFDLLNNKSIEFDFNFTRNFLQFYIKKLPKSIHYEILCSKNMFKVCLHIEDKQFITQDFLNLIDQIYNCIKKSIKNVEFIKIEILKIEISTPENMVNFNMNTIVYNSLNKLLEHFNIKNLELDN